MTEREQKAWRRAAKAAALIIGSEEQRRDPLAWWCLTELLYREPRRGK